MNNSNIKNRLKTLAYWLAGGALVFGLMKVLQTWPNFGMSDKTLLIVIDGIFEDGIINWGRIITLYTLVASLSIACKEKHIQYRAEDIATLVTDYVNKDKIHSWIMQNGGWNGFKSSFPLDRKVNRLLNKAYWVIGSIGIIGFVFYIYKKIY